MPAELDALIEKNIGPLAVSLDKALQNALQEYKRLRQIGQKGELSHIYISFLLSGVLCKLPWLRIDLYDENALNDITECCADWDVPNISGKLYHDADALAKQKDRIKDYELERAWLDASNEYYQSFERLLPTIINQCPVTQKADCWWHFGHFLGSTVVVWEKKKDEVL